MGYADLPLLSQIKGRLTWLDERQRVVAQNVANSDTPGYVARDLKAPTDFAAAMRQGGGLQMTRTSAAHIVPANGAVARFTSEKTPDSETTLDGNSVVVEEQMLKMAESRMAYDAAIGLYTKSMQMLRMAAKKPGA
ncbi:flagellar basal body rod protein FlgB [Brevundimonas sp.]|jgi:flagellar basal-body rod protein FlgB|uniref:flagellar basal body rod protein FlgB n=1 Tax=Brevundimonas sp. TaxID=1871086 RepID=UPI00378486D6